MSLSFTSFTFDQPVYTSGSVITLTVVYESTDLADAASVASAVNVTLADAASGSVTQSSDGSAAFPEFSVAEAVTTAQPVTVTATDNRPAPGVWVLSSNEFSGTAAPFTGTAVLTSTA